MPLHNAERIEYKVVYLNKCQNNTYAKDEIADLVWVSLTCYRLFRLNYAESLSS